MNLKRKKKNQLGLSGFSFSVSLFRLLSLLSREGVLFRCALGEEEREREKCRRARDFRGESEREVLVSYLRRSRSREKQTLSFPTFFRPPAFRRRSGQRIEKNKTRFFLHHRLSLSRFATARATQESLCVPLSEGKKGKNCETHLRSPSKHRRIERWPKHSTPASSSRRSATPPTPPPTKTSSPSTTSRTICSCRSSRRSGTCAG